jgi:hypothetical protein
MAKGRKSFFDRAEKRGSELDKAGIDGKPVHKSLEDGTKRRYKDAMNIWAEYGLPVSSLTSALPVSFLCVY